MADIPFDGMTRWQVQQDKAIESCENSINEIRPDLAVVKDQITGVKGEMRSLNRRMAWMLAFLGTLACSIIAASVVIALAAAK